MANIFQLIDRFVVLLYDSTSTSSSVKESRKEFFSKKKKDVYLMVYTLQQMLYNCISIGQFTKLHIVGHNHYAKFPHCRIHVNGAGKWKINIAKLYGHPFWRKLFVVTANMTKVVMDIVNVFKHVFHALHSLTVAAIVNVDYFSSLFLVLQKIV